MNVHVTPPPPVELWSPPRADRWTLAHTEDEFAQWTRNACRGDWCEYWRGELAADRSYMVPHAREVASLAFKRYEQRIVVLTQLRHGYADYSYLAKRV